MGRAGFGTGCVRSEGLADCKLGHEIFRREPFLLSHEPTCRYPSVLDESNGDFASIQTEGRSFTPIARLQPD